MHTTRTAVTPRTVLTLVLLVLAALAAHAGPTDITADKNRNRKLTAMEDAELRYAEKLVARGFQYQATGQWASARRDFDDAAQAVANVYTEEHPRVAELVVASARAQWTGLARKNKLKPDRMGGIAKQMARAVAIYEKLPPIDQDPLIEAYLYLGDSLTMSNDPKAAHEAYLASYDLMSERTDQRAANRYFQRPSPLMDPTFKKGRKAKEDQVVFLTFVIGPEGRVVEIQDQGSQAEESLVEKVSGILSERYFRPRIVDRKILPTALYSKLRFPADGSPPYEDR